MPGPSLEVFSLVMQFLHTYFSSVFCWVTRLFCDVNNSSSHLYTRLCVASLRRINQLESLELSCLSGETSLFSLMSVSLLSVIPESILSTLNGGIAKDSTIPMGNNKIIFSSNVSTVPCTKPKHDSTFNPNTPAAALTICRKYNGYPSSGDG